MTANSNAFCTFTFQYNPKDNVMCIMFKNVLTPCYPFKKWCILKKKNSNYAAAFYLINMMIRE